MIQERSPYNEPREPDSSELQDLVTQRRRRLSQTIDDLSQELSPSRLIARGLDEGTEAALEKLSHKTNDIVETATKEVKRNPWPLILVGAGLMLWFSRERKDSKR